MGMLIDGKWHTDDEITNKDGAFKRKASAFRNWVTRDGSAGPTGQGGFAAEPGRYHLHVSLACPWAHRTLIMRAFKGLEEMIGVSVVHWYMGDDGWSFDEGPGVVADPVTHAGYLREVYVEADNAVTSRVTVPVLWDKKTSTIVSNESAEIIRMFNSAFDDVGARDGDFYPQDLREEIDAVNGRVYDTVNNGVYKAGFARSQKAYENAATELFATLDHLEKRLASQRYLVGGQLTEADIRLFTTLLRFDPVYHGHFKCNIRRLADYPNLWAYTRDIYQTPGVAQTCNLDHIKRHYYESHPSVNPHGIVPAGPDIDYAAPHGRAALD